MQNDETVQVVKRFFEAFDYLISISKIDSVNRFCLDYKIDRRNFLRLRKDPTHKMYVSYLVILVDDFKISAHWLLTGKGEMIGK